jgi:hypothetical protein
MDHRVIDAVGALFEHILADPKVPPEVGQQIGRLQLPVLRAALADWEAFDTPGHPVRRWLDRLASLGMGLETIDPAAAGVLVTRIRELVQRIVDSDFSRPAAFEEPLQALERFVAEQGRDEAARRGAQPDRLAQCEADWALAARLGSALDDGLRSLALPGFVHEAACGVFTHLAVRDARDRRAAASPGAAERPPAGAAAPAMMPTLHLLHELVMSLQPKADPAWRAGFATRVGSLVQRLRSAWVAIGWPATEQEAFLAQLLQAHARTLRVPGLSTLEHNLLATQLLAALSRAWSAAAAAPAGPAQPEAAAAEGRWRPAADPSLGLLPAAALQKAAGPDDGTPATQAASADAGAAARAPGDRPVDRAPTLSIPDETQLGVAFELRLSSGWRRARLNHISPGGHFVVFAVGRTGRAVTMTRRMLAQLISDGGFRALETRTLLERAAERARRQLDALRQARPASPLASPAR